MKLLPLPLPSRSQEDESAEEEWRECLDDPVTRYEGAGDAVVDEDVAVVVVVVGGDADWRERRR